MAKTVITDLTKKANSIVKNHMIWSMGAGFIPLPIVDFFAVSVIQLDMIRQLSSVYDREFEETQGKALITALTGSSLARLGANAVKLIPGIGSVFGGLTLAILSGASTYALGEVFKKHFETGGTFLDFDVSRLKDYYNDKFEKGKEMAKEYHQNKKSGEPLGDIIEDNSVSEDVEEKIKSPLEQLESIAEMKEKGLLTEQEFEIMKKKILEAS